MGEIIGKKERADAVVAFFEQAIEDLQSRTADIPEDQGPSVYLGGVAFKGPHGFGSGCWYCPQAPDWHPTNLG